jgi:hypothetical protein
MLRIAINRISQRQISFGTSRLMSHEHSSSFDKSGNSKNIYQTNNKEIDLIVESTRKELFKGPPESNYVNDKYFDNLINKNRVNVQNIMLKTLSTELGQNRIDPETKTYLEYVHSKHSTKDEDECGGLSVIVYILGGFTFCLYAIPLASLYI